VGFMDPTKRRSTRNSRFIVDWNAGMDEEVLRKKYLFNDRRAVRDLASCLRRLGYTVKRRLPTKSKRKVWAETVILRTRAATAVLMDADGKQIGTMDPMTRKPSWFGVPTDGGRYE
jgi:hypothetical protein